MFFRGNLGGRGSITSHKNKHSHLKFKPSVKRNNLNKSNSLDIKFFVFLFAFFVIFRTFFYDNFYIPSGSMKPTLLVGDTIIVSKMSYGYSRYSIPFALIPFKGRIFEKPPTRGDIIVFKLPSDKRTNYVKRLIGVAGDKIQVKDGILYLNGEVVTMLKINNFNDDDQKNNNPQSVNQYIETLSNGATYTIIDYYEGFFYDNTDEFTVPPDHYFFMGDNRDNSQDSRTSELGFVHKDLVLGKVKRVLISSEYSLLNIFKWHKIRFDRFFLKPYISEGTDNANIQSNSTISIYNNNQPLSNNNVNSEAKGDEISNIIIHSTTTKPTNAANNG